MKNKNRIATIIATICSILLFTTFLLFAYQFAPWKWDTNTTYDPRNINCDSTVECPPNTPTTQPALWIKLYKNENGFPPNVSWEILSAEDTWFRSGALVDFGHENTSETPFILNADGHSAVGLGITTDPTHLAETQVFDYDPFYVYTSGRDEIDVVLNKDKEWAVDGSTDKFDVQTVLVHELGHVLGLADDAINGNVMDPNIAKGEIKRGLNSDDVAGIIALYGEKITCSCPSSGIGGGCCCSSKIMNNGEESSIIKANYFYNVFIANNLARSQFRSDMIRMAIKNKDEMEKLMDNFPAFASEVIEKADANKLEYYSQAIDEFPKKISREKVNETKLLLAQAIAISRNNDFKTDGGKIFPVVEAFADRTAKEALIYLRDNYPFKEKNSKELPIPKVIRVFPNPTLGNISIEIILDSPAKVSVTLYALPGVGGGDDLMNINLPKGFNSFNLNLSNYNRGDYLLVIKTNNNPFAYEKITKI